LRTLLRPNYRLLPVRHSLIWKSADEGRADIRARFSTRFQKSA